MLYKWVRDLTEKYTFITKTETRKGMVYLYYSDLKGVERNKRVPYRATKDVLMKSIEEIKDSIDYYDKKKKLDKKIKKEIKKDDRTKPIFITS